jgi:AraC-like DNA-binding protein
MTGDLGGHVFEGLGRSCEGANDERIRSGPAAPGVERVEARFFGAAFAPHRHDTYAIGVTLGGVQTFHYRGARRCSLPGDVMVLHPDEIHDGGAGSHEGLVYRMLYLEPALLRRALARDNAALPFVAGPVFADADFRGVLMNALAPLDEGLSELFLDDLIARIAEGLTRHAGRPLERPARLASRSVRAVRDYLDAHATRTVRSAELEKIAGLDRYALSRHFRALFATSPHRFHLMRRLERARRMIENREPLAEIAAATGFADQSHLNRQFKKAFGLTPGRWASLTAG